MPWARFAAAGGGRRPVFRRRSRDSTGQRRPPRLPGYRRRMHSASVAACCCERWRPALCDDGFRPDRAVAAVPAALGTASRRPRHRAERARHLPGEHAARRSAVLERQRTPQRLPQSCLHRRAVCAVDRGDLAGPAAGQLRAQPIARVRARTQRTRTQGRRRAPAAAAGTGRAALFVQHAGQHPTSDRSEPTLLITPDA